MDYTAYINPELLVVIPVLYFAGFAIKKSLLIKDKYIPIALIVLGVFLSALWCITQAGYTSAQLVFTAVVQGVLCAGGAVLINQTIKQTGRRDESK